MPSEAAEAPSRLSQEVILDACVRIADQDGSDAVTLRRLGVELGMDPTAVYRHFRDKDDLLRAMADRLLLETAESLIPTGQWRDDVRNVCLGARRAYLAHPRLALLLATAPAPLPNSQRLTEAIVGALRSTGLTDEEVALAYQAIENFTVGSSFLDAAGTEGQADGWRRSFAVLPADAYPNLTETAGLMYRAPDAAFEYGLDLMLDAIQAKIRGAKPRAKNADVGHTRRRDPRETER